MHGKFRIAVEFAAITAITIGVERFLSDRAAFAFMGVGLVALAHLHKEIWLDPLTQSLPYRLRIERKISEPVSLSESDLLKEVDASIVARMVGSNAVLEVTNNGPDGRFAMQIQHLQINGRDQISSYELQPRINGGTYDFIPRFGLKAMTFASVVLEEKPRDKNGPPRPIAFSSKSPFGDVEDPGAGLGELGSEKFAFERLEDVVHPKMATIRFIGYGLGQFQPDGVYDVPVRITADYVVMRQSDADTLPKRGSLLLVVQNSGILFRLTE